MFALRLPGFATSTKLGLSNRCYSKLSIKTNKSVRCPVRTQAMNNKTSADPVVKYANSIGLPTNEGIFGFRPFAEIWCGRLAMMGFVTSIAEESVTGQGTLAQIHLMDPGRPNITVLAILCAFFGGLVLVFSGQTLFKLRNRELTGSDIARYKNFLSLNNAEDYKIEAMKMKQRSDFTNPGVNLREIEQAKAEGTPADAVLSANNAKEEEETAREMKSKPGVLELSKDQEATEVEQEIAARKQSQQQTAAGPSIPLSKREDVMDTYLFSGEPEMRYAQDVELKNGRSAMVGFLAAVLVEAATGNGIIGQLLVYAKTSGLLGPESGF